MKLSDYLNETIKIKVGKSYRGKDTYPSYTINNIKDGFVEYTMHTASGGVQKKMKLSMFKRIKNLRKV